MTLQIVGIATGISHISVTGVTICDLDKIPAAVDRLTPLMYPDPDGFITDMVFTRDTAGGAKALMTLNYTLNYTFDYAIAGAGRIGLDLYDDMVTKACAILDALFETEPPTGAVKFDLLDALAFGKYNDPSGNEIIGCKIRLRVREFIHG